MEGILPLVFCGGFPKSLHQLNEAELERFLVYVWNFTNTPEHAQVLPDVKCYDRTQSLRQLICSFYERLGLSYLLYFSEGLAKTKGSNIYYEIDRANKNIIVWNKRSKSIIAKIPASNVCYDSFAEKITIPKIRTAKSPPKKKNMREGHFPVIDKNIREGDFPIIDKNIREGDFPIIDKVWSDAEVVHIELLDSDDEKLPDNQEKEVSRESIVLSDSEEPVIKKKKPAILRSQKNRDGLPRRQSDFALRLSNGKEQVRERLEESLTSIDEQPDFAGSLPNGKEQASERLEESQRRSSAGLPQTQSVVVRLSNGEEQERKIIEEYQRRGRGVLLQRQSIPAVSLLNGKCSAEVPFISKSVSITKLLKDNRSVPFISKSISVTKINQKAEVSAIINDEIVISDSEETPCQTTPHKKVSNQLEEIVISDSEDLDDIENKRNYLYRLELCDSTNEPDDPIILPVPGKGDFNKFHRLPLMMVPLLVKHSLIDRKCIQPGPPGQNIPSTSTSTRSVSESVNRSNRAKNKYGRYRTLDLDSCRDYHFPKKHYRGVLSAPLPLKKRQPLVPPKIKTNKQKKSNQGIINCKRLNPVVKVRKLDDRVYLEHLKKCV